MGKTRTQWDAAMNRMIQETVQKKVEEQLSTSEFPEPLVRKIAENISEKLARHPEIREIIKAEIGKVARKEGLGLSAVRGKSRFVRNWILFVAGIGVGTYGLVALIGWLARRPRNDATRLATQAKA